MIFLVRHGEAAAAWGNHPDPGLSELGRKQAESVAEQLKALGATHAITSPMQRCRETARPFERAMGVTAPLVEEVSEIATPNYVTDRVTWLRRYMAGTWAAEGSEHLPWRDRMMARLAEVADTTVVFSHFVAINAIVSAVRNDARTIVFRPGHCSITQLVRENGLLKVKELGSESATRVL
ncbi:MAG: histidine phosphatase family protein [Alphaproteobacteria bacterium]|nr:histidine phosphatase family protein [Hyphomonas sp.]MBR9805654.1 histidine phosphatase family protein [Alphaproteobacteria bacterium]